MLLSKVHRVTNLLRFATLVFCSVLVGCQTSEKDLDARALPIKVSVCEPRPFSGHIEVKLASHPEIPFKKVEDVTGIGTESFNLITTTDGSISTERFGSIFARSYTYEKSQTREGNGFKNNNIGLKFTMLMRSVDQIESVTATISGEPVGPEADDLVESIIGDLAVLQQRYEIGGQGFPRIMKTSDQGFPLTLRSRSRVLGVCNYKGRRNLVISVLSVGDVGRFVERFDVETIMLVDVDFGLMSYTSSKVLGTTIVGDQRLDVEAYETFEVLF